MSFYTITFRLPDKLSHDFKFHSAIACLGEIYGLPVEPKDSREFKDAKSIENPCHPLNLIDDSAIGNCGPQFNPWKMSSYAEKLFYADPFHLVNHDENDDDDDATFASIFCQIMTSWCGNPVKDADGIIYGIVVPTFN